MSQAMAGANISSAQGRMLHDNDLDAANTFDHPDRIVPRPLPVRSQGGRLEVDLAPLTVATLTVALS